MNKWLLTLLSHINAVQRMVEDRSKHENTDQLRSFFNKRPRWVLKFTILYLTVMIAGMKIFIAISKMFPPKNK